MFRSLRSRLWLSYGLVTTVALAIVAAILLVFLIRNPLMTRNTQRELTRVLNQILEKPVSQISNPELISQFAKDNNVRIIVYNNSREVVVDTDPDSPQIPFPRRTAILRGAQSVSDLSGNPWVYAYSLMRNGQIMVVTVPRPRVPVLNIFADEFFIPIVQAGIVSLLFSLLIAFLISRWVADPLQQVVAAARVYPEKIFTPVPLKGPHEVQDLTRAFNSMMARVDGAQRSQKDFIANVSHELKTPLTSIQGFAQAILDGTAGTQEERIRAAQIIYTEAGRMQAMAVGLLELARLEAGTIELDISPLDVNVFLNNIIEKFSPLFSKQKIRLLMDLHPSLKFLNVDSDKFAQVVNNLLENALKFTPTGGEVVITGKTTDKWAELTFADTGPGVPPEALRHLFERFYQVDSSREGGENHGAGLGLAIAKEIVDAHGGSLKAENQQAGGLKVVVRLPSQGNPRILS